MLKRNSTQGSVRGETAAPLSLPDNPAARQFWLLRALGLDLVVAEELAHIHPQALGQGMNHRQCGVGHSGLNSTHVGAKQPAVLRQVLLGETGGGTKSADALPKGALMRDSHLSTLVDVHYFIHTLIRTFERFREMLKKAIGDSGPTNLRR